jgi:hypothetical protein
MCRSSVRCTSDLPGVNPATNDRKILYYGLMTKVDRSQVIVRYFPGRVDTMCGPHGGKNGKMKSWTISWLSLKTKVEPGLRGSQVMSGDWWILHRVCGVSSGSPENHSVP